MVVAGLLTLGTAVLTLSALRPKPVISLPAPRAPLAGAAQPLRSVR
jgi:hypothetical protein